MLELVKTLAEEPAKRKKVLIFYIRIILSSIVAAKLYIKYYGDYILLNPYDKEFFPIAFNFFISGKAIVVGFLYLLCHFILFEVLSVIPPLALNYITNRKSNNVQFDNGFLGLLMYMLSIIEKNKITKQVQIPVILTTRFQFKVSS